MDQLPRLGKRELICLLLFTCNYVVFVRRGFLFLWVLGMGYVILLWHSLSLPYNYFENCIKNLSFEQKIEMFDVFRMARPVCSRLHFNLIKTFYSKNINLQKCFFFAFLTKKQRSTRKLFQNTTKLLSM